jgi:hypothetical protein
VDAVEIYASLAYHIVVAHHIFIPKLDCEYVGIHFFWFGRVIDLKLPTPVKRSTTSASPVYISLLWITGANETSDIQVVTILF